MGAPLPELKNFDLQSFPECCFSAVLEQFVLRNISNIFLENLKT